MDGSGKIIRLSCTRMSILTVMVIFLIREHGNLFLGNLLQLRDWVIVQRFLKMVTRLPSVPLLIPLMSLMTQTFGIGMGIVGLHMSMLVPLEHSDLGKIIHTAELLSIPSLVT